MSDCQYVDLVNDCFETCIWLYHDKITDEATRTKDNCKHKRGESANNDN